MQNGSLRMSSRRTINGPKRTSLLFRPNWVLQPSSYISGTGTDLRKKRLGYRSEHRGCLKINLGDTVLQRGFQAKDDKALKHFTKISFPSPIYYYSFLFWIRNMISLLTIILLQFWFLCDFYWVGADLRLKYNYFLAEYNLKKVKNLNINTKKIKLHLLVI